METKFRYVPILKLKMGEINALKGLQDEYKKIMIPLFEIPPIPYDYSQDKPSKTLEKHIEKVAHVVKSCCTHSLFLDFVYVSDDITPQLSSFVEKQFLEISKSGIKPIPVVYLSMEQDYTNMVCSISKNIGNGVCLRIESADFEEDALSNQIDNLLENAEIPHQEVDIVLDMGMIPPKGTTPIAIGIKNIVRLFPKFSEWRSITLAATSFPETLSAFGSQTATTIDRPEWEIWNKIATADYITRTLHYGDYGIASPEPFQMDPRMMKLGAKIKYTLDEQWLIVKGKGIKRGGSGQFHSLAKWIVESKHYYGEEFSSGDKFIGDCAKKATGPGSQTSWVSVGMNHHFAVTAAKLSKLS